LDAAKKADYFIFVNGSSKHQAFYTVTNCRKDIIYPAVKGASSIVAAFIASWPDCTRNSVYYSL
jgi:hypothetical protein